MKAAKAWCLTTVVLMAGISLASCGKDEGTGGGGMVLGGGTGGGGAGTAGSGGNVGRAGSGGGVSAATKLGQACVNDTQCNDPNAPGLTCVTAKDTSLDGTAPPKGICTAPCTFNTDECAAFGAGALCYPFDAEGETAYCVEGCSFGEPNVGEPTKCHGRSEFACYPALLINTQDPCTDDSDCQSGEICDDNECAVVEPACLPACRGDNDCEEGLYCDQSFLQGACVPEKPVGKRLGEPCTVAAGSGAREPDECLGFCQADETGSTKGHCATSCGLGRQCAWDPGTEKYDGLCLFVSSFTNDGNDGTGDFGFCTLSCDCGEACNDASLGCTLLTGGELNEQFRGAGLCLPTSAIMTPYDQCTDPGAGGAGGTGAGGDGPGSAGAGAGGAPGDAGAGAGGVATP